MSSVNIAGSRLLAPYTVVHMSVISTPGSAGGRNTMKELNVIGTMQLLAACQKSRTVRRLVVKSSAAVYGSTPRDPAMFTEDMGAKRSPSGGFGKDSIEVEGYVRGFARRRPDVSVGVLRFTDVIGPGADGLLLRYLRLPVAPGEPARRDRLYELVLPAWHDMPGSKLRWYDFARAMVDLVYIWRDRVAGRPSDSTASAVRAVFQQP